MREQPPALPEPMMSGDTSAAASAAFGRLGETLLSRALNERPIEDLTRDLLRTMIKQWLDDNLPDMVERLVREEIARVARRGGR
jgi:cell pole-organizing protein PopZ